jgi:hypothetical protein
MLCGWVARGTYSTPTNLSEREEKRGKIREERAEMKKQRGDREQRKERRKARTAHPRTYQR